MKEGRMLLSSRNHSKTAHYCPEKEEDRQYLSHNNYLSSSSHDSSVGAMHLAVGDSSGNSTLSQENSSSARARKQSRRIRRPPLAPHQSRDNSCYFSSSSSDYSTSAAAAASKQPTTTNNKSKSTGGGGAEPEIFLRNPRTGGFDYTPAQREYQQHVHTNNKMRVSFRDRLDDAAEEEDDDVDTLNDSDIYTTFSRPVPTVIKSKSKSKLSTTKSPKTPKNCSSLLSPRSKNSFQRYFQTKATKTPSSSAALYSPPEGGGAARASWQKQQPCVTPSPKNNKRTPINLKSLGNVVQQLKCKVTGSPPRTIEAPAMDMEKPLKPTTTHAVLHKEENSDDDDDQSSSDLVHYLQDELDEMTTLRAGRALQR